MRNLFTALAVVAAITLAPTPSHAGICELFGFDCCCHHNCGCASQCGCGCGCDSCCEPACGCNSCCEPACGCSSCCEPCCGCGTGCCANGRQYAGQMYHCNCQSHAPICPCVGCNDCGCGSCCEPACGCGCGDTCCEPACGCSSCCEPCCGCGTGCCSWLGGTACAHVNAVSSIAGSAAAVATCSIALHTSAHAVVAVVKCTGANGTTIRRIAMTHAITAVSIRAAVDVADVVVAAAVVVVHAAATVAADVKVVHGWLRL